MYIQYNRIKIIDSYVQQCYIDSSRSMMTCCSCRNMVCDRNRWMFGAGGLLTLWLIQLMTCGGKLFCAVVLTYVVLKRLPERRSWNRLCPSCDVFIWYLNLCELCVSQRLRDASYLGHPIRNESADILLLLIDLFSWYAMRNGNAENGQDRKTSVLITKFVWRLHLHDVSFFLDLPN